VREAPRDGGEPRERAEHVHRPEAHPLGEVPALEHGDDAALRRRARPLHDLVRDRVQILRLEQEPAERIVREAIEPGDEAQRTSPPVGRG